ncbi:hypothetical protein ACROYT_G012493 [Oculina patagonica]
MAAWKRLLTYWILIGFFISGESASVKDEEETQVKQVTREGSNPRQVGLDSHNEYRRVHNAPGMQLTSELNDDAQRYASKLARESLFKHDSKRGGEGENLGLRCGPGSDTERVKKVVDAWYKEVCQYNFNNGVFSRGTGHFTQVVWKRSTQLGIGYARGSYTFRNGKSNSYNKNNNDDDDGDDDDEDEDEDVDDDDDDKDDDDDD